MTDNSLETNINTHSRPTDLRITDLRIVNLRALPFDVSLLRIDTNQGISGYGEVRRWRQPDLRPAAQITPSGRKPLQHRQDLSQN